MRFVKFVLMPTVLLIGCGGSATTSPTAPSASPSTAAPGAALRNTSSVLTVLRGTVVERTSAGERPIGGALVWGHPHGGPLLAQVRADDVGRFELPGVPAGVRFQVLVWKQGYFQQCATETTVGERPHLDVPLVAEANLSSSREAVQPSQPAFRVVAGAVFESTTQGRRPIVNRLVFYDFGLDPAASTVTDAQGRFLLCGLPQSSTVSIAADFGGGIKWAQIPPGGDADIEIDVRK